MENWDDQHFKSEWQQAFDGAEVTPSEQVWNTIDARIIAAENAKMKKRVVFYQRLAAASVGVMFLVSGYAFFSLDTEKNALAENTVSQPSSDKKVKSDGEVPSSDRKKIQNQHDELVVENSNGSQTNYQAPNSGTTGWVASRNKPRNSTVVITDNSDFQRVADLNNVKPSTPASQAWSGLNIRLAPAKLNPALPVKAQPNDLAIAYRIADAMPAKRKKKGAPNHAENSWAALGLAAGSFNPSTSNLDLMNSNSNAKTFSSPQLLDKSNSTRTAETKPGSSYSMSISGGKRVGKRWLVQGGLSYLNQQSETNTSTVTVEQAFNITGTNSPENFNAVTSTVESEINSTFQFISLPVQAGYMLVDQKFGVQLNGGFSPDVFLKSTISDKATQETVNTSGSNSTFKTISLSGLGGVELSYRFSDHYRIALVPGFRYSLTPVYKENSLASAKPFMADIGLRFRYVF